MARHKDSNWTLNERVLTWDEVTAALLMDIRDELKRLNGLLHCGNFTAIPATLRDIRHNTRRKKKPAAKLRRVS